MGEKRVGGDRHPGAVRAADQGAPRQRAARARAPSVVGALIYEKDKPPTARRSTRRCGPEPDFLYLNGYAPDTVVVLRDLYRANINLPQVLSVLCRAAEDARYPAGRGVRGRLHRPALGRHRVQAFRLSADAARHCRARLLRSAGDRLGQPCCPDDRQGARRRPASPCKDNVRKISQGSGEKVYTAVEGLKALAEGKEINYEGASRSLRLHRHRRHHGCRFRYMRSGERQARSSSRSSKLQEPGSAAPCA